MTTGCSVEAWELLTKEPMPYRHMLLTCVALMYARTDFVLQALTGPARSECFFLQSLAGAEHRIIITGITIIMTTITIVSVISGWVTISIATTVTVHYY